jgi:hypothetical protein
MNAPNPYEPPRSASLEARSPTKAQLPSAWRGPSRRPISVWVLLAAAWCFGLFFGAGIFKHLFEAIAGTTGSTLGRSLINAGILLFVSGYLVVLAIAIQRRSGWLARTLGTLLLVLVALIALFGQGTPSASCGASPECVQGWWLGRLAMVAVVLAWAITAGWSPGAKRYYKAAQVSREAAGEA